MITVLIEQLIELKKTIKVQCRAPFLLLGSLILISAGVSAESDLPPKRLTKGVIADVLTDHALDNRFPSKLTFENEAEGTKKVGFLEYTFDPSVHENMANVYSKYKPDFACFVAIDVETGAILNF